MNLYCRADVLRILHITAKQLVGWQRAGLAPISETFTFYDLLQLKKIRDLRAKRVRPAVIRESLQAMQKQVAGMENPLLEASAFSVGSRVAYRHEGHSVEPIAGQFVMDFGPVGTVVSTTPLSPATSQAHRRPRQPRLSCLATASPWRSIPPRTTKRFAPTFACWRSSRNTPPRISTWALCITTGRISPPPRSIIALLLLPIPRYALAYFDLGNVLDETGHVDDAIAAYRTAIQLAPTYADAHYNLALAYERKGEAAPGVAALEDLPEAGQHGPWAVHARNQVARILEGDKLKIVYKKQK